MSGNRGFLCSDCVRQGSVFGKRVLGLCSPRSAALGCARLDSYAALSGGCLRRFAVFGKRVFACSAAGYGEVFEDFPSI